MNLWQDAWSPLDPSLQHSLDEVSNNQREQQSVTATHPPTRGNKREDRYMPQLPRIFLHVQQPSSHMIKHCIYFHLSNAVSVDWIWTYC